MERKNSKAFEFFGSNALFEKMQKSVVYLKIC